MRDSEIQPSCSAYRSAVYAVAAAGEWEVVLLILAEQLSYGQQPEQSAFMAALRGCRETGNWCVVPVWSMFSPACYQGDGYISDSRNCACCCVIDCWAHDARTEAITYVCAILLSMIIREGALSLLSELQEAGLPLEQDTCLLALEACECAQLRECPWCLAVTV